MHKSLKICGSLISILGSLMLTLPHITGMLGVNVHTARKIVDSIAAGAGIWTILALCFTGASLMAITMATGKALIKKFGKAVAITW